MKKLLLALAASVAAFVPIHAQSDPFSSSITIYVRTTATDANIYLWGTVGSQTNVQLTDAWPGATLTKKTTVAGKEFYYLTCYDATEIKAILSNGSAQTDDLGPFTADTYLEYDGARAAKVIDPFETPETPETPSVSALPANILHCFNWPPSEVTAALPEIAAGGFGAVQISPLQRPDVKKEGTEWYRLYRPYDISFQPSDFCSEAELKTLCAEADKLGIKVIVDVVANHVDQIAHDPWWDSNGRVRWNGGIDQTDRNSIITGQAGDFGDIVSEKQEVIDRAVAYVTFLRDCGVDGIRWDSAKNIGLPSESCGFWNGVTAVDGLWHYGEILEAPGPDQSIIKEYSQYMSVTDDRYSSDAARNHGGVPAYADGAWVNNQNVDADKLVYWGESHSTYANDEWSQDVARDVIDRAYAAVACRNGATALYLSRPLTKGFNNIKTGKGSTDFTGKAVTEVNKFRNAMAGKKDAFLSQPDCSSCVITRQDGGAVIVAQTSGPVTMSNVSSYCPAGTYTDRVSGNIFTVTADEIKGTVGSTGIAVIYSSEPAVGDTFFVAPLTYKITSVEDKTVEVEAIDADAGVTDLVIPSEVNGYTVTSIAKNTFNGDRNLVSVVMPNTITSVGENAFYHCTNLASITLSKSLTSLPGSMLEYTALTSVIVPEGVTSLAGYVFKNCNSLAEIVLPSTLMSVGKCCFETALSVSGLSRTITLNSVTPPAVGEDALVYANQDNIKTHVIVPYGALSAYQNTEWATLTTSITEQSAPDNTFFVAPLNYKITSVEDKTVEVEAIDANAGITDLVIPSEVNGYTVTSIEKQTFQNDHKLVSVVIPNTITSIGSQVFRNCTALTEITVPESVTSIGEAAFGGCTNLASVYIKGQISTLNRLVFDQCYNLQSLVLPASLRTMSASVFGVKVSLNARIIFFGSPAAIVKSNGETASGNFEDVFSTSEIYVPGSLLSEYKETDVWNWRLAAFHTFSLTTLPAEVSALEAGKTQQLSVKLICADSSGEDENIEDKPEFARIASDGIRWTSSDAAVATVSDQGLVTAVAPGTAHITAETPYSSAVFAACPVTVKESVTGIDSPVSDSADALKVYAANGLVHVEGATPGAEVKVCDLSGRCLLTTRAHTFAAPARGLVLLTVASRTFKLTL